MAKHNETGIKGEQLAEKFLLKNGYSVLHLNWRHEKKEVDIVATKGEILVFIEVKTRGTAIFGFPEDAVTLPKIGFLKTAAEAYLMANPQYSKIQFDIISIMMRNGEVKEIRHFEDAFY